jgi:hypothetical protein
MADGQFLTWVLAWTRLGAEAAVCKRPVKEKRKPKSNKQRLRVGEVVARCCRALG